MAYLALSYDHRLVDGADAARFLSTLKAGSRALTSPTRSAPDRRRCSSER